MSYTVKKLAQLSGVSISTRVNWIKLTVLDTILNSPHKGYVEFIVTFLDGHDLQSILEKSEFIREAGRWYYVDWVQFTPN